MPTQCSADALTFAPVEGWSVVAAFDGGAITSDAGALLLGATDRALRLVERFAACFTDGRDAEGVVHDVPTLVGQRVFAIAMGYEDLVDHDELRHDPVLGVVLQRLDAKHARCAPLAGKSTLNRLEHGTAAVSRYHRIAHDPAAIEALFVDLFLDAHAKPPKAITLDLDATDDPLHGHQEGRFFHAYYDCWCYLPLYVFCGRHLLVSKLRRANIDASAGAVDEIARVVERIRVRWPRVWITLRADSGFAREALMSWCEEHRVDYVFGLARNNRLVQHIAIELAWAEDEAEREGRPARRFSDFRWTTLDSWSRRRRVVAKAEWMPGRGDTGANPRFVVTSLKAADVDARTLYEDVYCARGEIENRLKECQLDLFADRTSAATMRANQLRLWFASMAYVLLAALRRIALAHTELANATCGTIRLKLLKIGAQVTRSVRRIKIAMASACPSAAVFRVAHARLCP
jgi:DNA-directed RNA polymerase subunit K/omega